MLNVRKICCPTDFSDPSYEAFKVACDMALHFSAELILVHVVTPVPVIPVHDDPTGFNLPLYEKEMEQSAARALVKMQQERVPQNVKSRTVVLMGGPASQIVSLADTEQMDMIIIATHGFTGWRKFMFGSVTEKVIRYANCPVLSIRVPPPEKKHAAEKNA